MTPRLSILICSIVERAASLEKLLALLQKQLTRDKTYKDLVEILVEVDDHRAPGRLSIGAKRQRLLEAARGDYVCFIDDDDRVATSYVADILRATETGPDVVGITGIYYNDKKYIKPFHHTVTCRRWHETATAYWRTPNHLNPIKREHALRIGFHDMNHGEDKKFSDALAASGLLKTEVRIERPIYHYEYSRVLSRSS